MSRRKRKKKNPYLGEDPLPENLVSSEEIVFREELLGEFDDDVFGRPDDFMKPPEPPPPVPEPVAEPVDDLGLSTSDKKIIPPEMLVSVEVENEEGRHFTLFVSEVTTAVKKVGPVRVPMLKFKVQMAMARYFMVETATGTKRPAIDHAPITDFFFIELPMTFLPTAVKKFPDMVSPALATKILIQMMDKYSWNTIKPAPKSDIERLIPDEILNKMRGAPKGPTS